MENASKALLIAAAVLIVILLVAFGMQVFNSAGTSSGDAEAVGDALSTQTGTATEKAQEAITGKISLEKILNKGDFRNIKENDVKTILNEAGDKYKNELGGLTLNGTYTNAKGGYIYAVINYLLPEDNYEKYTINISYSDNVLNIIIQGE